MLQCQNNGSNAFRVRRGSLRSFAAIRMVARFLCGSFLRKGKVFACVERISNLQDLKNSRELETPNLSMERTNFNTLVIGIW